MGIPLQKKTKQESMEKKDLELLMRDLCARLPYAPKVVRVTDKKVYTLIEFNTLSYLAKIGRPDEEENEYRKTVVAIEDLRPVLRNMADMTLLEAEEYARVSEKITYGFKALRYEHPLAVAEQAPVAWLDERGFDHRGLIGRNLAVNKIKYE